MGSVGLGAVRRSCMRLGTAALVSLVLSTLVMMFLADAPPVATWFLASAVLAGLAYGTAILAAYLER